jgi:hypothetical protein
VFDQEALNEVSQADKKKNPDVEALAPRTAGGFVVNTVLWQVKLSVENMDTGKYTFSGGGLAVSTVWIAG